MQARVPRQLCQAAAVSQPAPLIASSHLPRQLWSRVGSAVFRPAPLIALSYLPRQLWSRIWSAAVLQLAHLSQWQQRAWWARNSGSFQPGIPVISLPSPMHRCFLSDTAELQPRWLPYSNPSMTLTPISVVFIAPFNSIFSRIWKCMQQLSSPCASTFNRMIGYSFPAMETLLRNNNCIGIVLALMSVPRRAMVYYDRKWTS